MTYQVLARKWRPRNFQEMAGQGHVLKTLINSLDNDRLHHAYLFTGTRGVGKTTIARILARCLNCEEGVTSEPCGKCSACTEIDEGRFIDLIEVDAASRTKVEDTRELLDNVQYSPTRGRFKVYLIDEVHMLSGHSFNALLKTLEEPPPHVKFLLATTDPQKLPVTVLSRCLQFNLKNISPERLVEHIKHILEEEKVPFEEPALWQLGRAAQGSVRDCLTLLDQAIGYCDGNITDSEVSVFLGTIDQSVIHELVDALIGQDAVALLNIIETAADHAPDFSAVLTELQSYLHRIAIAQAVPEGIDNSQGDRDQVKSHANKISAERLQLYYQVALKSREDMPYAIDARSGLEMALLRMLAFTPEGVPILPVATLPESGSGESSDGKKGESVKKKAEITETQTAIAAKKKEAAVTEASVAVRHSRSSNKEVENPQIDSEIIAASVSEKSEINKQSTKDVAPTEQSSSLSRDKIALEELKGDGWIDLFHQLELDGITRSIASNCLLSKANNQHISLLLDKSQASVFNDEQQRRINAAFDAYFEKDIDLDIELGSIDSETPAAWRQRMEKERMLEAIQTFESDTTVQEIVEKFSGAIKKDTIESTKPKQY
ncbi:MAG: DNA polymerase III subunit gamma/tau [Gammaproteobacteria bacterium]|nr:DNA polymerase III subunit gamma/tau [Gammaproteobacteria bacterium]